METRIAAKGSIYAMSSNTITLSCGFIVSIFLARCLGPERYGLYGLTMSILLWVELAVMVGIPSTYKKVLSENSDELNSVLSSVKKIFIPYCLVLLIVFTCVTPLLGFFFDDRRLISLLSIAGIDIPVYGIYFAYNAILNGHRAFFRQNISISFYALSKTILTLMIVIFGFGIQGALLANVLASLCGALMAFFFVNRLNVPRSSQNIQYLKQRMLSYGLPILLAYLAQMFLIHIDIWLVKSQLDNDRMVGYYSIAYILSRPPLMLITALATVTFPSVSRALTERRIDLAQKHIKQVMRLALLILLPLIVIITTTADELLTLFFTSVYVPASFSLKILFIGISMFSIFFLFLTLIASANKPLYNFFISSALIPVAIIMNYVLIKRYGIEGAALATNGVSLIGALVTGSYLWSQYGMLINIRSLAKISVAAGCLYIISDSIPASGYYLVLKYCFLFLIYGGELLVLREINRGDLSIVKETFNFKRNS